MDKFNQLEFECRVVLHHLNCVAVFGLKFIEYCEQAGFDLFFVLSTHSCIVFVIVCVDLIVRIVVHITVNWIVFFPLFVSLVSCRMLYW